MQRRRRFTSAQALSVLCTLSITAFVGCQSSNSVNQSSTLSSSQQSDDLDNVALAALDGIDDVYRPLPDMYVTGAGDSLGQAVFIEYIAWIRDTRPEEELRYATGAEPLPDVD